MFAASALAHPTLPQLAWYVGLGLPIAWIDLRSHRIPNRLSAALASGLVITSLLGNGAIATPARSALGLAGALLLIYLLIPGSIGAGDIKLAFSVGWFSYPSPLLLTMAIACATGLIFGLSQGAIGAIRGQTTLFGRPSIFGRPIPFAPFLLLAGLSTMWTPLH